MAPLITLPPLCPPESDSKVQQNGNENENENVKVHFIFPDFSATSLSLSPPDGEETERKERDGESWSRFP